MNAKKKGSRQEHRAIKILESAGYSCTRAAGSLGMFDIIAIGRTGIRLVQVKSNRGPRLVEREALEEFKELPDNATKEIWLFRDRIRDPLIETL